jgi:hypothetical protein
VKKIRKKKEQLKKNTKNNKKTARTNRLEEATVAYFASLSPEALGEENRLGAALAATSRFSRQGYLTSQRSRRVSPAESVRCSCELPLRL